MENYYYWIVAGHTVISRAEIFSQSTADRAAFKMYLSNRVKILILYNLDIKPTNINLFSLGELSKNEQRLYFYSSRDHRTYKILWTTHYQPTSVIGRNRIPRTSLEK
jgi:hypothetical protein